VREVAALKVSAIKRLYAEAEASFGLWEVVKDVVDEFIDL
jgi:hypothetical protein